MGEMISFLVACPDCGTEHLTSVPLAVVTAALAEKNALRTPAGIERLAEYIAVCYAFKGGVSLCRECREHVREEKLNSTNA
jgi:hypothetical protein